MSALSNFALVGCFIASANWGTIRGWLETRISPPMTSIGKSDDPMAVARVQRTDNETLTKGVQSSLKQSLAITFATRTKLAAEQVGGSVDEAEQANLPADEEIEAAAFEPTPTAEETQGMRVAPILKKDRTTGQLEIGNFKSLSFLGETSECLDMGYSMLGDTGTSNDLLQILATTNVITVAKICAKNGSIIITCRNDQITISPRHSRPDDKCHG